MATYRASWHRRTHHLPAVFERLEARTYLSAAVDDVDPGDASTQPDDSSQPSTDASTEPGTQASTQPATDTQPTTQPDVPTIDPGAFTQPTPEPSDNGASGNDLGSPLDDTPEPPPAVGPMIQLEFNGRVIGDGADAGFRQGTSFGGVNFGFSSQANILTVRNTGDEALDLDGLPYVAEDKSDFATWTDSNTLTIQPGDTLNLALQFTPQDIGPRAGTLVIPSDAVNDGDFTTGVNGEGQTLLFDNAFYLQTNPDVAQAVSHGVFATALDHFAEYGRYENRAPDAFFDAGYYAAHNGDVLAAVGPGKPFGSLFDHFLRYGQEEGRVASPLYSESLYVNLNPDVRAAVAGGEFHSGLEHFVAYGQFEDRNFSPVFNDGLYLAANPDVASAVRADAFATGLQHFIFYGEAEGRSPAGTFNETDYLAKNPDVAAAVASGSLQSGLEHYVLYGRLEGRAV